MTTIQHLQAHKKFIFHQRKRNRAVLPSEAQRKKLYQAIVTEKELKKIAAWEEKTEKEGHHLSFVGLRNTWKVGRRHLHAEPDTKILNVCASDLELRAMTYLRFVFKDATFKTQVPLLPLKKTIDIANELCVIHPRDWQEHAAKTMSTDIVMEGTDRQTKERKEIAVFIRYYDGLYKVDEIGEEKPITREWQKIDIAEEYHTKHLNQQFEILTDRELSKSTEYSINWLREFHPQNYTEEQLIRFITLFLRVYSKHPVHILEDLLELSAKRLDIPFSECLNLFRYCGTHHYLPLNITKRINLSSSIEMATDEIA
ncbi:MAG: hypothetical protein ACRBB6_08660 [Neptuniibacter sp.]